VQDYFARQTSRGAGTRSEPASVGVLHLLVGVIRGTRRQSEAVNHQRLAAQWKPLWLSILFAFLASGTVTWSQQGGADWQTQLHEQLELNHLETALIVTEFRLAHHPADLEAHGWRARILAWQGSWVAAESEYRYVLEQAPQDTDILTGLADVLLWQGRDQESLMFIERARKIAPTQTDLLVHRARILRRLNHAREALEQYRQILKLQPQNREARRASEDLAPQPKYEVRTGVDASTFNYSGRAASEVLAVNVLWSERISTSVQSSFTQRFQQNATKLTATTCFHLTEKSWFMLGGAGAGANIIVPQHEVLAEYGQAFTFPNRFVRGAEISYQQHWFWYQSAHVLTIGINQLYYLPRNWAWSLNMTGARSGFTGTGVEWLPSGSTRLLFPLYRSFSGNVAFANGTENFAVIDQIGRFSARTYAGGLKYRYSRKQDLSAYFARQQRSQGRIQDSFGMSYGLRF
jgi:Tfp pilus assembly protein PilF